MENPDKLSDSVAAVNSQFAEVLSGVRLARGSSVAAPPAHLCRYRFGEKVLSDGKLSRPEKADPAHWEKIQASVKQLRIPLCFVLRGEVEVFTEGGDGSVLTWPQRVLREGQLFGLFEVADFMASTPFAIPPTWAGTAGPRTIHIVAPVSDQRVCKHLRRANGLNRLRPSWTTDPWQVCHVLARECQPDWHTEIIVFHQAWLGNEASSSPLHSYLLKQAWRDSAYIRSAWTEDRRIAEWAQSHREQHKDKKMGDLRIVETIRHIMAIAAGAAPAFRPCHSDRLPGSRLLRQVESRLFDLMREAQGIGGTRKSHYPAILRPTHLESGESGYYSIRLPSIPGQLPHPKRLLSDSLAPVAALINQLQQTDLLPTFCSSINLGEILYYGNKSMDKDFVLHPDSLSLKEFVAPEKLDTAELVGENLFFNAAVKITRRKQ